MLSNSFGNACGIFSVARLSKPEPRQTLPHVVYFPLKGSRACVSCQKKGKKDLSRIIWEIMIDGRPFYHLRYDCVPRALFLMHRLYFLSHPFSTPFFLDSRSKAVMSLFQSYSCKLITAPSSEAQRSARRRK